MGLFILPERDTTDDYINAAIENIELFLRLSPDVKNKHLLETFAVHILKRTKTMSESTK